VDFFIDERFLVQNRRFACALVLPRGHIRKVRVVALGLALGRLEFLAEMAPQLPMQRIQASSSANSMKSATRPALQRLVESSFPPVTLTVFQNSSRIWNRKRLSARFVASFAALFPEQFAQLAVQETGVRHP
jgi:hypothetical protein